MVEAGRPKPRPSQEWVNEARNERKLDRAKVFALYAGQNAHGEGKLRVDCPFHEESNPELRAEWLTGFDLSADVAARKGMPWRERRVSSSFVERSQPKED